MWRLDDDRAYRAWREMRLADTEGGAAAEFVTVSDLANPRETELAALRARCARFNLVLYRSERQPGDDRGLRAALRSLAGRLGLRIAERHRSVGAQGIVALTFSDAPRQRGYIPYSRRGMNWHTDGYYNDAASRIRAFLLHCARPAARGGENRLLDPEIAYIRLRDENPAHVAALMQAQAMTIPENREADGSLRPASVGPVFATDPATGRLVMRYTARTRSIEWRNDPAVRAAADCLREILSRPDPAMIAVRLKAGEGVLNNNVLHDRTAFEDD
ncbi:MAG: taurine catabolism dioxygenase TauD, partial [Alphaproteobacteria bacterium]